MGVGTAAIFGALCIFMMKRHKWVISIHCFTQSKHNNNIKNLLTNMNVSVILHKIAFSVCQETHCRAQKQGWQVSTLRLWSVTYFWQSKYIFCFITMWFSVIFSVWSRLSRLSRRWERKRCFGWMLFVWDVTGIYYFHVIFLKLLELSSVSARDLKKNKN